MGSKVWQSAVTSDHHCKRDFWSLDRHNEAVLCLIKALLSVMLLPVSLFIAASLNLPLLSIALFICRMLCCLSCSVDFLSLYVALSFYLAASSHGNLAARASQPMPPCGTDEGRVGWAAIDRIWVLSDSNARERVFSLSMSQNNGDADCGGASVLGKKQLITSGMKCLIPLFLTKLNNSRVVTNDLSSSESHQGRAESKYRMNRQLHQGD